MGSSATENALAQLSSTIIQEGMKRFRAGIEIEDDNVPFPTSESESESDNEEETLKPKQKPKPPMNVQDRMYCDNQKLWSKLQKVSQEFDKTEEKLHYMKLEHNNKCVEVSNCKQKLTDFRQEMIKMHNSNVEYIITNKHFKRKEVYYNVLVATMLLYIILGPQAVIMICYCMMHMVNAGRDTVINIFT